MSDSNPHIFFQQRHDHCDNQYYCLLGKQDYIDEYGNPRVTEMDDDRVVAKAVQSKRPKHFNDTKTYYRFYIKMNPNSQMFNPIDYHSSIQDKSLFAHVNQVCKHTWQFKEVDKSIFDKYILFLKTKNIQTLKDIERQIK